MKDYSLYDVEFPGQLVEPRVYRVIASSEAAAVVQAAIVAIQARHVPEESMLTWLRFASWTVRKVRDITGK